MKEYGTQLREIILPERLAEAIGLKKIYDKYFYITFVTMVVALQEAAEDGYPHCRGTAVTISYQFLSNIMMSLHDDPEERYNASKRLSKFNEENIKTQKDIIYLVEEILKLNP